MQELEDWEMWNIINSGVKPDSFNQVDWVFFFPNFVWLKRKVIEQLVSVLIWCFRRRYMKVFSAFLLPLKRILWDWNSRGKLFPSQLPSCIKTLCSRWCTRANQSTVTTLVQPPKGLMNFEGWIQAKLAVPCSHKRLWELFLGTNIF